MTVDLPSGTVTLLFTDIERSTRLLQRLGDEYAVVLADQRFILRSAFTKYRGVEIDTQGDAFFVAFRRGFDAIQAVVEAQRALAEHKWPQGEALRVRMGLHTGEPLVGSTGYVGLDVHRTARICSAGHGGQVLLSEATCALVEQSLPKGLSLRDLGLHRLKDLQRPEHLFQLLIPGLETDFPPLKSLDAFPNNLPLQLTSFIGREREIEEIKQRLASARLLTLTGVGGAGKTRLALQTAADLLESFKDGVWLVELASLVDPTQVPQALAMAFSLREQTGISILDSVVDYLSSKRLLLILDNCEHLLDACGCIADTLLHTCSDLKILATSREGLGIAGECLWTVPSLSLPQEGSALQQADIVGYESIRLFVDRARHVNSSFSVTERNAAGVVQVCRRLDGIPLAIELAAARLKAMTVEQLASRLDDRFHLLTGGSRTALPRQQTLQALIDWSFGLLSEPEQGLFCSLSVFAGGSTLEAAEAVCSGEGLCVPEVLELLSRLVDKSLVTIEPQGETNRYRMLETIRQYAREKALLFGNDESMHRRHLKFYRQFVEKCEKGITGTQEEYWLKQLDQEKDNFYAALNWAVEQQEDDRQAALHLAGGLMMWWLGRGYLSEGRAWLKKTLKVEASPGSPRAKALTTAGSLAWLQNDFPEAARYLEESLSILRALDVPDPIGLANTTHILGHIALDQKDSVKSRLWFTESLGFYRELQDQYYIGTLISDLGLLDYHEGDLVSARSRQQESLEIFSKLGNPDVIAQTQNRLGELARLAGDYDQAARLYESSLEISERLGFKLEVASGQHKLSYIAKRCGDFKKARSLLRESLSVQQEVGNKQGIAECLAGFAGLAVATGQPERALRLFAAAQALLDSVSLPLAPAARAEMEQDRAFACSQLDEPACSKAAARGRELTVEEAILDAFNI